MDLDDGTRVEYYEGYDKLIERSSQPDRLTIVSLVMRAGANQFIVRLEHEYFKPGTEANNDFDLHFLNFGGVQWWVVMVPLSAESICDRLADACAIRLAKASPVVIDHEGPHVFPVHHDRVRYIENIKDSRVYENRGAAERIRATERDWIRQFLKDQK